MSDFPTNFKSEVPFLLIGKCNPNGEQRLDTFVKPKLDQLLGANRTFEQAKDSLKQCNAQKKYIKPQIAELAKKGTF
jgi:hypothetical protein